MFLLHCEVLICLENPLLPKKDNSINSKSEDNWDVTKAVLTLCDKINISQESTEDLR